MSDREEAKRLAAAIRKKCRDCCCGMESEIKGCRIKSCPLWEYRTETKEEREKRKRGKQLLEGSTGQINFLFPIS